MSETIWDHDLILRDDIADEQLRPVLASAFAVRPEDVFIIHDIEEILQNTQNAPVVVQITRKRAGDFLMLLAPIVEPALPKDHVWSVERLAAELRTDILIGDASSNPFAYILISPNGARTDVFLDDERMDLDDEEYVLLPPESLSDA